MKGGFAPTSRAFHRPPPSAGGGGGGGLTLSWNAITQDTDGNSLTPDHYNVYAGGSDADLVYVTSVSGGTLSYTFTGLSSGTYYFAVKAVDSGGVESAMSEYVTATVV